MCCLGPSIVPSRREQKPKDGRPELYRVPRAVGLGANVAALVREVGAKCVRHTVL